MSQRSHLIEIIDDWLAKKHTGSITINFFEGGISNLTLNKSVKLGNGEKNILTNGKSGCIRDKINKI